MQTNKRYTTAWQYLEVCDNAEEQKHLLDFPLVPDELFIQ